MKQNYKNYLDSLNNHQLKAVTNTDGAYLVLAGAGSGKTRVLTIRIFHLLVEKKAFPGQILAVTFTNKAASEMKTRVASLLNQEIENMWIGTFHSLSAKILRKHSELVGLKNNFVIIDSDDQLKLIKKICDSEKINTEEKNPKYFLNAINNLKNKGIFANDIDKKKSKKNDNDLLNIYNIYQSELLRLNCADFGDLILQCIKIFRENKNILSLYQKLFKYILVDEYQDINNVQQLWLEYLYKENKNICCVGDDDQSIYSWRGANINNILKFNKYFANPTIIRLEQNYRSTQNILNCASSLIKNNDGRYGKKLWSNNLEGERTTVSGFWETKEEAIFVSDEIEKLIAHKSTLSEIAILFRVSAHTRSFEERFINLGMPYKIIGGLRFYERKEIKDIIAYLRIVNNLDDDLAYERIVNVPKRGVGKTSLSKINEIARKENISMFEGSKLFVSNATSKANYELNLLINKIIKWNKIKKDIDHIDLAQLILEDSSYLEYLEREEKNLKNPESLSRIDNIKEFIESLKEFENLEGFLDHVSLVMENIANTHNETISLMTIHSAKGLEFDYVFLAGWEEGVFPNKKSIEEVGKSGLEEERRLAYVAMTRARKKLNITYVNQNRYSYASHDYNMPSRFIEELPKELIDLNNSNYFKDDNFVSNFLDYQHEEDEILTPGRKRIINNKDNDEIDWDINQDISYEFNFKKGAKVFHQKYGKGIIISTEGDKAYIDFDEFSKKKVFLKYLKLKN